MVVRRADTARSHLRCREPAGLTTHGPVQYHRALIGPCSINAHSLAHILPEISPMDLRDKLTPAQLDRACQVLDYQPFILSDELQTGAAYSWMYNTAVARSRTPMLFDRRQWTGEEWDRVTDANA